MAVKRPRESDELDSNESIKRCKCRQASIHLIDLPSVILNHIGLYCCTDTISALYKTCTAWNQWADNNDTVEYLWHQRMLAVYKTLAFLQPPVDECLKNQCAICGCICAEGFVDLSQHKTAFTIKAPCCRSPLRRFDCCDKNPFTIEKFKTLHCEISPVLTTIQGVSAAFLQAVECSRMIDAFYALIISIFIKHKLDPNLFKDLPLGFMVQWWMEILCKLVPTQSKLYIGSVKHECSIGAVFTSCAWNAFTQALASTTLVSIVTSIIVTDIGLCNDLTITPKSTEPFPAIWNDFKFIDWRTLFQALLKFTMLKHLEIESEWNDSLDDGEVNVLRKTMDHWPNFSKLIIPEASVGAMATLFDKMSRVASWRDFRFVYDQYPREKCLQNQDILIRGILQLFMNRQHTHTLYFSCPSGMTDKHAYLIASAIYCSPLTDFDWKRFLKCFQVRNHPYLASDARKQVENAIESRIKMRQ